MVAAKLANLDHGTNRHILDTSIDASRVSQPAAASMLNVSVPSVQRAKASILRGKLHESLKMDQGGRWRQKE
jgi:hypothetical protein